MTSASARILVIVLIFIGEALSIYAELLGAQKHNLGDQALMPIFWKMFLVIALAGAFLILGYILGFGAFKNIWIVSVVSLTAILVTEPFISYALFHQLPTRGAWIGLACGLVGSVCAMMF